MMNKLKYLLEKRKRRTLSLLCELQRKGWSQDDLQKVLSNLAKTKKHAHDLVESSKKASASILSRLDLIEASLDQVSRNQSVYVGNGIVLTRLHTGQKIYVMGQDVSIASHLMFGGRWEAEIEKVLLSLVRPGMRVLDIGANHGYYTLLLTHFVGKTGEVHAFEANPHLAQLIKKSIAVNGLGSVAKVINSAVYSCERELLISFDPFFCGGGHLIESDSKKGTGELTATVKAISLDDYYPPDFRADLIKIDTEGAEYEVFRGMTRLLERSPKVKIVSEFSPSAIFSNGNDPLDFLKFLERQGFSLKVVGQDGVSGPFDPSSVLERATAETLLYLLLEKSSGES